jgi:hypothetical protein
MNSISLKCVTEIVIVTAIQSLQKRERSASSKRNYDSIDS